MNRDVVRMSTPELIAAYDEAIANRWIRCNAGSSRFLARQGRIDALVNQLSARADLDDPIALDWYDVPRTTTSGEVTA